MLANWIKLSFGYFIIAAMLGAFLRYFIVNPVAGLNFQYLLHTHSHIAFLGWIFNALFAALIFAYIPEKVKVYKLLFWLLQIAVVGMLITFPIQGYAAASITFSTMHIFLSWWFAIKFYRDTAAIKQHHFSLTLVRWSLLFMAVSAIGPFSLGAIMAQGLSGTHLYNLSIYFYLHFQYNGWFSFAVFGLFFWLMEKYTIPLNTRYSKNFLVLMIISCIPGYALSTLWTRPETWVYITGMLAAASQLAALAYLLIILRSQKNVLKKLFNGSVYRLMCFSLLAFSIKVLMQFFSAFPAIADLAFAARNFTIGYLHIVFLGFVSVFLIAWFSKMGGCKIKKMGYWGVITFLVGFVVSEFIIFLQPFIIITMQRRLPWGHELLFIISILMPLGLCILFFNTYLYHQKQS